MGWREHFDKATNPSWHLANITVWVVSTCKSATITILLTNTLHWRHNDFDSVSNHQPHGCLFNPLFRRRSKKTSKLRVTGLCRGNSPGSVNSPHKGPVMRKMFPFDDVIMIFIVTQWWMQRVHVGIRNQVMQSADCQVNTRLFLDSFDIGTVE